MTGEIDPWMKEILNNPELLIMMQDSMGVLEVIGVLMETKPQIRPVDISEIFYNDQLENFDEDEKNKILKKKQSRISRMISNLKVLDLIKEIHPKVKSDGRERHYCTTEKGKQVLQDSDFKVRVKVEREKLKKKNKKMEPEDSLDSYKRKYHSDDIHELLVKMKKELKNVLKKDSIPDDYNYYITLKKLEKFTFENDLLFDDLSFHLGTFLKYDELIQLLSKFKIRARDYITSESKFEARISMHLDKGLGIKKEDEKNIINTYKPALLLWTTDSMDLLFDDKQELFLEYYVNFSWECNQSIARKQKVKQMKVNGEVVLTLDLKGNESTYSDRLKTIMKKLEKSPIYIEYVEIRNLKELSHHLLADLLFKLEKELRIPVYPGKDCPYLNTDR